MEILLQERAQAAGDDVQASHVWMQAVRHEIIVQPGLHGLHDSCTPCNRGVPAIHKQSKSHVLQLEH